MRMRSISRTVLALVAAVVSAGAFSAGCGADNALVGGTCAAGYRQCGLHCVKIAADPANCGACGHACQAGTECSAGACGPGLDGAGDALATTDGAGDVTAVDSGGSAGDDASNPMTAADAGSSDVGSSADSIIETDAGDSNVEPSDASGDDAPTDGATAVGPTDSTDGSSDDGGMVDTGSVSLDSADASGADDSSVADSSVAGSNDASDGAPQDDSIASDGSPGEAANPCTPPLVSCGGTCIDVTGDPLNCGACNVVCASQLCDTSSCVGAASGGIVYIGHDYTTTLAGTAQARVLSNAAFVPDSNPLHVMSYERYAAPSAITHVDAILNSVANQEGRTLRIASTTSDDTVRDQLALPTYDVLLVHDQSAASDGTLAALGAEWASTLSTFTLGGGVVIVLDGGSGIGQMPAFASATGLLSVSAHSPAAVGTPLLVTSHVDFVGIGVISPYGAGQSSVSLTTEANGGNVVYVVEISGDAAPNAPIVVHKAF